MKKIPFCCSFFLVIFSFFPPSLTRSLAPARANHTHRERVFAATAAVANKEMGERDYYSSRKDGARDYNCDEEEEGEWFSSFQRDYLPWIKCFGKSSLGYALLCAVSKRKLVLSREELKRCLALGGFSLVYKYLSSSAALALPAAYASTVTACLVDPSLTRSNIVCWALCRYLKLGMSDWTHLGPLYQHGPVLFMCLSSAQILTSFFAYPSSMEPGYRGFLYRHGGHSRSIMNWFTTLPCSSSSSSNSSRSMSVRQLLGLSQASGLQVAAYFAKLYYKYLRMNLPLYGVLFLVFELVSILRRTRTRTAVSVPTIATASLKKLLVNTLRSSVFLSTYCFLAWASIYVRDTRLQPIASQASVTRVLVWLYSTLWISGLSVLIDTESRRSDLAAYCCTYALDSVVRTFKHRIPLSARYVFGVVLLSWFIHQTVEIGKKDQRFRDPILNLIIG